MTKQTMARGHLQRVLLAVASVLCTVACTSKNELHDETVGSTSEAANIVIASRSETHWAGACPTDGEPPSSTFDGTTLMIQGHGDNDISLPCVGNGDLSTDSDQGHFVYWPVTGDAEIIARVQNIAAPRGKDRGQFGVMIRAQNNDDEAHKGAGVFSIGAGMPATASVPTTGTAPQACAPGLTDGMACTLAEPDDLVTCFEPNDEPNDTYCACSDPDEEGPAQPVWDCGIPIHDQMWPTWKSDTCGHVGSTPVTKLTDRWIRLQRVGQTFSVAFKIGDEPFWRPMGAISGGEFAEPNANIGLFVSNLTADVCGAQNEVRVWFDNISVKHSTSNPPFEPEYRTTWIGSHRNQMCTLIGTSCSSDFSQDMASFHVFPGTSATVPPLVYKHTSDSEGQYTAQVLEHGSARVSRGTWPLAGHYVPQGAIAVDPLPSPGTPSQGQHVAYVATGPVEGPLGPYCVNRSSKETLFPMYAPFGTDPPCDVNDPEQRLTAIGGMAAVQHGNQNRLYVTQPDRDGNLATSDPRIVEMRSFDQGGGHWRMEVNDQWTVDKRPGPITGGHGRLWVAHTATDYFAGNLTNMMNYDVPLVTPSSPPETLRASLRCYKTTDGSSCAGSGQTEAQYTVPACVDTNGDAQITGTEADQCVVNPTAIAFIRGTTLSTSSLVVADNGRHQQFVRFFNNLSPTGTTKVTEDVSKRLGVPGGVYSGQPGLLALGAQIRLYNPVGVGVDYLGDVYVGLNGLPGADIRKFKWQSGSWAPQWTAQALMGFARGQEAVAFDPTTDGHDAYSFNKHFEFNPDLNRPKDETTSGGAMAPGSEWSLKSLTWDPLLGERDPEGRLARGRGVSLLRHYNGQRYLFVLSSEPGAATHLAPNGHTYELTGIDQALVVYRFNGEIAQRIGAIKIVGIDADPVPKCSDDCTCTNSSNDSMRFQLRVEHESGTPSAIPSSIDEFLNTTCAPPTSTCLVIPKCFDANGTERCDGADDGSTTCTCRIGINNPTTCPIPNLNQCTNYGQCNPPLIQGALATALAAAPSGIINGFDVDANLNVWLATNYGGGFSVGKILRLPFDGTTMRYSTAGVKAWTLPQGTKPFDVRAFPTECFVLTETQVLRLDSENDTTPDALALLNSSPYDPGYSCAGYKAFDVAGSKIFVSNRCGAVEVYNKDFYLSGDEMVNLLFAGPELNGFQTWQDSPGGLRAFQRNNGEYLVNTVESSYRAANILFRWHP
jgi:hypothetical protein